MSKPSKIDAYVADLGIKSDAAIAKLAGVSVSAVYQYRRGRGIGVVKRSTTKAAPRTATPAAKRQVEPEAPTRKGSRGPMSKLDAHVDIVGVLGDGEVAKRVGLTPAAVAKYRVRHGIPSATEGKGTTRPAPLATKASPAPAPKLATRPRASKLDVFRDVLCVLPDAEVARRSGVTREAVRQYKLKRGITSRGSGSKAAPAVVPATARAIPRSATRVNTHAEGVICWRVSLADGGVTHIAARTVEDAARKAHAALGGRAVGVVLLGSMSL